MGKVSVIVPVYNAENYVGEAIESVLNQTYRDFELILIDDRSADRSREICEAYRKKDHRIVVLENTSQSHGPGPTRNIGLDHATGEYLLFLDSDDRIRERLLEQAVGRMRETGADIVEFGMEIAWSDGHRSALLPQKATDLLTKAEIRNDILHFLRNRNDSLVMHLFRREPIKRNRFHDGISGEDFCYVMDAMRCAGAIGYIEEVFYDYRYVAGSASHRWNDTTITCRGELWRHQKAFLDSLFDGSQDLAYEEMAFDNYIWAIYQLSTGECPLSFSQKRRELRELAKTIDMERYRSSYPLKLRSGLDKIKYALVKYHMDDVLLWLSPLFLRIVRGAYRNG